MLRRLFDTLLLCLALCLSAGAQELNCKVTLRHDKITGVDQQVFTNMQNSITELINAHKWTNDEYAVAERIDCSIFINLIGNNVNGDPDAYTATLSIQATRPVYNSSYTTKIIDFVDKDVTFHYSQFSPLHFDDNQITGTDPLSSNLSAIIGYYCYLVLGLDYDSFSPEGGTPFLKKAQNIVNNAPDGKGINGWKSVENTRNRYWIVDELLNNRYNDVRSFWYTMHREGLDSMSVKPNEARERILTSVRKLYNVNRDNPSSILLQFVFDAKADEFQHLLAGVPKNERGQYATMLSSLDVPNAAKYNALK
jgi:Domain of unknown function (DUF4835)